MPLDIYANSMRCHRLMSKTCASSGMQSWKFKVSNCNISANNSPISVMFNSFFSAYEKLS